MIRLGDVLVEQGTMTEAQRDSVLSAQQSSGRPFGVLAEEMFGVCPKAMERAWQAQFAARAEMVSADDLRPQRDALDLINRRQAWQFKLVPMRVRVDAAGIEVTIATSPANLARALRFASRSIGTRCVLEVCEEGVLLDALEAHYPLAGARDMAAHSA
jgi:hypothetical protein